MHRSAIETMVLVMVLILVMVFGIMLVLHVQRTVFGVTLHPLSLADIVLVTDCDD